MYNSDFRSQIIFHLKQLLQRLPNVLLKKVVFVIIKIICQPSRISSFSLTFRDVLGVLKKYLVFVGRVSIIVR